MSDSPFPNTPRVDARDKVRGAPIFAADNSRPSRVHAVLAVASIGRGQIVRLDTEAAGEVPGVLLVLTHETIGPVKSAGFLMSGGYGFQSFQPLLSPAIAYRGPDETGIHVAGPLAFGHLRLAIIDPTGGHQPRVDPVTGYALLYNGEIYGFAALAAELTEAGVNLIDRSDTEVLFRLLQRQGVAATLEKIDGMFTFAFYEAKTQSLHLARDRFGEKPLYYAAPGGGFIFGSEPRAVLAHPACRDLPIDPGAVASFLSFEYLPGQRGLRQGLCKLPAGHVLTHARGRTEIRCYWRPDPDEAGSARARESEGERLERLEALLDSGVRDRLIADVPVGVFLSGGLDSSAVAWAMRRHAGGPVKSFAIGCEGDRTRDGG